MIQRDGTEPMPIISWKTKARGWNVGTDGQGRRWECRLDRVPGYAGDHSLSQEQADKLPWLCGVATNYWERVGGLCWTVYLDGDPVYDNGTRVGEHNLKGAKRVAERIWFYGSVRDVRCRICCEPVGKDSDLDVCDACDTLVEALFEAVETTQEAFYEIVEASKSDVVTASARDGLALLDKIEGLEI